MFGSDGVCSWHTVEGNFLACQSRGTRSLSVDKHGEAVSFSVTFVGSNHPALLEPREESIAFLSVLCGIVFKNCIADIEDLNRGRRVKNATNANLNSRI